MKKRNPGVWMLGLFLAVSAFARPRPAHPPIPEGQLAQFRYDLTNNIEDNVFNAQGYTLVESWSGYALQMAGSAPRRWLISTVRENGRPQVTSGAGTIRFWFAPYWASKSAGGAGPGARARLLEIGHANSSAFWLSLAADPDGNRLKLFAVGRGVPAEPLLDAPIQWSSNQWHMLALVYGTDGFQLVVDGNVLGSTPFVPSWPPASEWPQYLLAFGGGFQGQELAQSELDELTTFAGPLNVEYLAWQYRQTAPIAAQGPISPQEEAAIWTAVAKRSGDTALDSSTEGGAMTMSSPPPEPPGGGGGGGGTSGGSDPPPPPPGLKLTAPVIVGSLLSTSLKEADTNTAYEIFHNLSLVSTSKWVRAASGDIGQTNFSVTVPSTNAAFYRAAEIFDTDFDGLSDAYEQWVSGTSKTNPDTDGDGIPDGKDDANSNGVPDYIDYAGLNRAVIWASRPSAFEGALSGELTIRLPTPAPTNNTLIVLHLSRNVDYDGDYFLTKLDGVTRVTNDVFFAAGETQQRLLVHAINDTDQAPRPRTLQAKLASSANYQLDWEMAEVALIDNDLPTVYVFASDSEAGETNINPGQFRIVREGVLTNALSVQIAVSGTATPATDYTTISTPVTIPANSNAVSISVNCLADTAYEGNETVILTLQANPAYQILPNAGSATVTIIEDDLPVVSLVGTDLVASEYAPTTATVTFRRTGITAQPLIVPFAVGGTATKTNDYHTLPAAVTIPVGSTDGTLTITSVVDLLIEQVETITITLKGSHDYTIGASNSVTVVLDDNNPTTYGIVQPKTTSVYNPGSIDSPAIIEMHRWGRASAATNVPFVIQTNASGGPVPTPYYRKYGDTGGSTAAPYAIFNPYQSVAKMYFTALNSIPPGFQLRGVDFLWDHQVWSIWYLPNNRYLRFEVVSTNAVEGGAQARVRLSRLVPGEGWIVPIPMAGTPTPADQLGPDHNLPSTFSLTLAANAVSVESPVIANTDGAFEGWETLIFKPNPFDQQLCIDQKDFMMFLLDNVADPNTLPESDTDGDGLSDRWELANSFDPFVPGEDSLDPDKDGLTTLEEYQNKLNPRDDDSDNDNEKDFAEANKEPDLSEFVEIRLRTQDTGKVNNGANCAVCHTVQLRVGDLSHFSVRPNATEKSFYLRKGTNYPIWLSEIVQNLPRPNQDSGSPNTTARYTAAILPPTNAPPAYIFTDPQNRLGTNKVWTNSFPVNPTIPIGTVTVARIEVSWTNVVGNVPLDANANAGGGLRVFPDRQSPTDGTARNKVRVRVRTIPPVQNQPMRLKSFDVDDPFEHRQGDPTFEIDANDWTGLARGNDNRGTPPAGQLAYVTTNLNASGEALIDFTVTFQPGDNFRVAALLDTPGALQHLDRLHVDGTNFPFNVSPSSNAVSGFVGGISPMLTVWRKLHLEFDSMDPPPATGPETIFFPGTVLSITQNAPAAGRSMLRIRHAVGGGQPNAFQTGILDITGFGRFRINGSSGPISGAGDIITIIEIQGLPGAVPAGTSVKLYDDDDRFLTNDPPLYLSNINLQSPPLAADARSGEFVTNIQSSYAMAYILPVDVNALGWNTGRRVPFKRNAGLAPTGSSFDQGQLQLKGKDNAQFWAYSVVLGYQPLLHEDGDPDNEAATSGLNADDYILTTADSFCVVWLEPVRDDEWSFARNFQTIQESGFSDSRAGLYKTNYLYSLYGAIAHEIGHAPASGLLEFDHLEKGLMQTGGSRVQEDSFRPRTLNRFRSTPKWTP